MKRKLVTAILCLALGTMCLTACGETKSDPTSADTTKQETTAKQKETTTKQQETTSKEKVTEKTTEKTTTKDTKETKNPNGETKPAEYKPADNEKTLDKTDGRFYRAAITMEIASETDTSVTVKVSGGIQMKNVDGWSGATVNVAGLKTETGPCACNWDAGWVNSALYWDNLTFTVDKTDTEQSITKECTATIGSFGTSTASATVKIPAKK